LGKDGPVYDWRKDVISAPNLEIRRPAGEPGGGEKDGTESACGRHQAGEYTIVGCNRGFCISMTYRAFKPVVLNLSRGKLDHFFVRLQNDAHWHENLDRIAQAVEKSRSQLSF